MLRQKKKLFWVYTSAHEEDWFIIANTKVEARKYHEEYEGFEYGYARASLIQIVKKDYEKMKIYHAQLSMLKDMGFIILSEAPYRVVLKDGKIYTEGSVIKFALLNDSIGKEGIYLVHSVGTDHYKIGITKNLHVRLKNMQTGSPSLIELYNFWKTSKSKIIESILHIRYRTFSIGGEWFHFTWKDIEKIHEDIVNLKNFDFDTLISIRDSSGKEVK